MATEEKPIRIDRNSSSAAVAASKPAGQGSSTSQPKAPPTAPGAVPLRYSPPAEPDKPPDVVEVLLRREAAVTINGHKLKLVEPPFRFYVDLLKTLVGRGDTGLLTRVGTALRSVAAKGAQAEVEAKLLESLIGESADFVCDFLARLILKSNELADVELACDRQQPDKPGLHILRVKGWLANWLADNVPAAGMCGLVSAALYVCDVATLRGFFAQAAVQWRPKVKT